MPIFHFCWPRGAVLQRHHQVCNWFDKSTWERPFRYQFVESGSILAIYLMEPLEPEPWKSLIEFIANHAVARYVLVASTSGEPGKPGMGMVWQHFLDNEIDYSVLRPSWFTENLSEETPCAVIRNQSKIYTACGDGDERYKELVKAGVSGYYARYLINLETVASVNWL
ncbi:hypothetical protein IFM53868_03106 [Aspergillus udagawae]|uniref:Uncharacterized protein n=1 Tax=Aspergillus udagawae TaxID=91492 RepID=A0ABQ1AGC9_9EURO|nr:hypothetical protein IFM53868_03106 [Aspergillus udagawae]